MAEYKLQNPAFLPDKRTNLLYPVFLLWGFALFFIIGFYVLDASLNNSGTKFYLLPWTFLTGLVLIAPSVYLFFKKKFDLFHPLVFASWSYFFPAFFIGGLILSSGFSNPYFLTFIQNEEYDLPLTLVYVMLGYGGLTIGFYLPIGKKIGEAVKRRLPVLDWTPEQVIKPSLLLLGLGFANMILAFAVGILGYQRVDEIGAFDGIIFLLTFFWLEASFLLWLSIFRSPRLNFNHYFVIGILIVTSLVKSAFQGNRGSLIQIFILVTFAFVLSGKKILFKHKVGGGFLLLLALLIGMIYGTTFRTIKTSQEHVSIDQYASSVFETFEKISDQDLGANLERGFLALTERFENVSQLAVVVSNYEALSTYEDQYGLDNNIWKDSVAFLIPRILWQDKPLATDPYKYGDLYFNYGENSFTLTPMGDLLRNFGPVGVPLGMIFLGIFLRLLYASLRENQEFSFWRAALYFMLLTGISYEGSFGLLIPYDIKIGLVSVLGLFIVWFFIKKVRLSPHRFSRI
jgi:oligosaccharide repeat unit polymerase